MHVPTPLSHWPAYTNNLAYQTRLVYIESIDSYWNLNAVARFPRLTKENESAHSNVRPGGISVLVGRIRVPSLE